MRLGLSTAGAFLLLIGLIWAGQGANLIGGSFMTGDPTWLVIGAIATLAGAALLLWANTGTRRSR